MFPFLWETQVGHFVTTAALGGGREAEYPAQEEGEEGGPHPPQE